MFLDETLTNLHNLCFVEVEHNVAVLLLGRDEVWVVHGKDQALRVLREAIDRGMSRKSIGSIRTVAAAQLRQWEGAAPAAIKVEQAAGFILGQALIVFNYYRHATQAQPPGGLSDN